MKRITEPSPATELPTEIARRGPALASGRASRIPAAPKVLGGLSRSDARAMEQALIEVHGLIKNGGTLMNVINSIAKTNPIYAESLARGYELLQTVGYH
jgi:hypothetical protein